MMALRASGGVGTRLSGALPLPRPNDHAREAGALRGSFPGWVARASAGDEANAATDLIIKHHASASLGASLFILYLSRRLIAAIKQASKNKLQQLKNTALKALALHARDPRGDNADYKSKNVRYEHVPSSAEQGGREAMTACATAKRWHRPKSKILGIGFAFSGRVYGAQKAATFKMLLGSVPFNTLDAKIDYATIMQQTRNGT